MTQPRSPFHEDADEQAAVWWLRYRAGDADLQSSEPGSFGAWLAADSRNGEAWDAVLRTGQALDDLPRTQIDALRPKAVPELATTAAPAAAAPKSPARRAFLGQAVAAGVAAAAVGGASWWTMDARQRELLFAQSQSTQRGQLKTVSLPDGSQLRLDTDTQLSIALYRNRREVAVLRGQAMFDVAHDAARPFQVLADAVKITVVGTQFLVRNLKDMVSVEVEQGQVRVEAPSGEPASVLLSAGDSVRAVQGRLQQMTRVAGAIAPWRSGRLAFDDVPLGEALEEFVRYVDLQTFIQDPAVAAMRVTGSFEIARADGFVSALPQVLPVRLNRRNGITQIERR